MEIYLYNRQTYEEDSDLGYQNIFKVLCGKRLLFSYGVAEFTIGMKR